MSIFFISADVNGSNVKYKLDSTSKIQVVDSGSLTKHPIQSGAVVSDHYVNNNIRLSFAGTVSDLKAVSNPAFTGSSQGNEGTFSVTKNESPFVKDTDNSEIATTAASYLAGLQKLKSTKTPFTVEAGSLGTFLNCMFTSLTATQTSKNGSAQSEGVSLDSYAIAFSVEQIRFGAKAEVTTIRPEFVKAPVKTDVGQQETKAGVKKEITPTNLEITQKLFDSGRLRGF